MCAQADPGKQELQGERLQTTGKLSSKFTRMLDHQCGCLDKQFTKESSIWKLKGEKVYLRWPLKRKKKKVKNYFSSTWLQLYILQHES